MESFKYVEDSFDKELSRLFADKPEVLSFLKNHDRKSLLFDNLKSEIITTELKNATLINQDQLKFIGKEFAKTFSSLALEAHKKKVMTKGELAAIEREHADWDEVGSLLEEVGEKVETYGE